MHNNYGPSVSLLFSVVPTATNRNFTVGTALTIRGIHTLAQRTTPSLRFITITPAETSSLKA